MSDSMMVCFKDKEHGLTSSRDT